MVNNLTPYSVAIVYENIYFSTLCFKFNNKLKMNADDFFKLLDYLISKYGNDSF